MPRKVTMIPQTILFCGISYNIDSVQPNFQSLDYMKITAGTRKAGGENDIY